MTVFFVTSHYIGQCCLQLIIHRVGLEDAGRYTCQADDKQCSAELKVKEKKILYHFTRRLDDEERVRQKKDIILECMLNDPRPAVKWLKNGQPLEVGRLPHHHPPLSVVGLCCILLCGSIFTITTFITILKHEQNCLLEIILAITKQENCEFTRSWRILH